MKMSQRWIDLGQIAALTAALLVSVKGVMMRQDVPRYISLFTLTMCGVALVLKVRTTRAAP